MHVQLTISTGNDVMTIEQAVDGVAVKNAGGMAVANVGQTLDSLIDEVVARAKAAIAVPKAES